MKITLKHSVLGLALMTAFGGAHAQSMQQDQPAAPPASAQQQPGAASIPEQKIEQFAEAEQKVSEIQQEFREKLQKTDDQQKARDIQMSMQKKMRDAVEDKGLNASEYNQIAQLAMQDRELRQRIEEAK